MTRESLIPLITINDLIENQDSYHIIDVRSPGEFEEFHIPFALSYPIFTNEERAKVGTTYKQIGQEEAKQLGIELVSPKLPLFYKNLKELQQKDNKPILIYCARGGMRSRSIASVLLMMGLNTYQLEGGIRSYRYRIMEGLTELSQLEKKFIVIEGHTGTKKTVILNHLEKNGYPVLDLEGLAGHRGSIFGQVGLKPKSQKTFEQELYFRLLELSESDYLIVESESKRIGRILVPDWIMEGKKQGIRIHINCPLEDRINHIVETYQPEKFEKDLYVALSKLQKRLPQQIQVDILKAYHGKNYHQVVKLLLLFYYDPRYNHAAKQLESKSINIFIENFEQGIVRVKEEIGKITHTPILR